MKFLKYLIFAVAFGLLPLVADYINLRYHPLPHISYDWREVIARGQLLLISSAIGGVAIGEVIGSGKDLQYAKVLTGGLCGCVVFLSGMCYGTIANDVRLNSLNYAKAPVEHDSIILFFFTLVASSGCFLTAKDEKSFF